MKAYTDDNLIPEGRHDAERKDSEHGMSVDVLKLYEINGGPYLKRPAICAQEVRGLTLR